MKASLEYIDNVMDRAIEEGKKSISLSDADKAKADQAGRKIIGGFRVKDREAEKKALDAMVAKRMEAFDKFKKDRSAIQNNLKKYGITPLAVCPTEAWKKICRQSGMYILSPDKNGQVFFDQRGFLPWKDYSDKKMDSFFEKNHLDLLRAMFPGGVSLQSAYTKATVILPDPPEDVAETLVKASSLNLKVAAVPEAIRFAEKPSELARMANTNPKDLWAQAQGYEDYADWLKRDPIIFVEQASATAIIAQFGEFPIEQEVVDAVVRANNWLLDTAPTATQVATTTGQPDNLYRQMVDMHHKQQAAERAREMGLYGTTTSGTTSMTYTQVTDVTNSALWTDKGY